jgi:glycerol-3-phosphate acyltransferase PlsY
MLTPDWLVVPAAYLLGGVSPGYWLVRLRTGADVRGQGSGATGATNAARVLGRGGFLLVLALDAAKGAVAAGAGRFAGLADGWEFLPALAAIAGHIWPVQLGFRGGRGLGPLLGAWLVLSPPAIGACLLVAGLAWAVFRRRIAAGLLGTALLPLATWLDTRAVPAAGAAIAVAAIVAAAHRPQRRTPTPGGERPGTGPADSAPHETPAS